MRPPSMLLQFHKMLWLFCTVLMLFNNVADAKPQGDQTMGLVGISPNAAAGVVDLSNDSWLITSEEEWNKYKSKQKNKKFKPCKVQFNADDGIEVLYDDDTSKNGCSVDLVVSKDNEANFIAKVTDNNNCIGKAGSAKEIVMKSNDNLLPFIIGKDNAFLETHTKGPIYGNDKDCPGNQTEPPKTCSRHGMGTVGKCMKSTVLEIGWSRFGNGQVYGHLHQVDEPVASWYIPIKENNAKEGRMDVKMTSGQEKNINIEISDKSSVEKKDFPGAGQEQPVCNKPKDATKGPIIWKVSQESAEELEGERILFFHFFPRTATRRHEKNNGGWKLIGDHPNGPQCEGSLSFIFPKNYVEGILVVEPLLTPISNNNTDNNTSTTNSTELSIMTEQPTGSNETEASPNATDSTAGSTETGSTGAPAGLSLGLIIGIVVGAVVGVIVVAVLVYFCCCRDKKEDDKDEDAESRAVVVRAADKDEDEKKEESSAAATAWETNSVKGKEEEINSVKATDEEFNQAWNEKEGEINSMRGTEEEFNQAWNKKEGDNSVTKDDGDNSVNKKGGKSNRPLMSEEEEAQYNSSLKGSLKGSLREYTY